MKIVLLISDREPDAPRAHRCRLGHRLRARICAPSLDRALARGSSPDSTILLSLRAEALISTSNRTALGRTLRRVVTDAARPLLPLGPVSVARHAVLRHRQLIQELAAAIDRAGPVDLRGLAATEVLLRDPCGPLYRPDRDDALGRRLEELLEILTEPPADFTAV